MVGQENFYPFFGHGYDLFAGAIYEGFRLTSLDTGGVESIGNTLWAAGAFVRFVGRLIDTGNVECAVGDAIAAADAFVVIDHDEAQLRVGDGVLGTGFFAACLTAVEALVLAEQPMHFFVFKAFTEADEGPGFGCKVVMALDACGNYRLFGRQGIPLLTGHRTGLAGGTFGGIVKDRHSLSHIISPSLHSPGGLYTQEYLPEGQRRRESRR